MFHLSPKVRPRTTLQVAPVRRFPTWQQASRYIGSRIKHRPAARFAIAQSPCGQWTVCRLIRQTPSNPV